jgi:ubiquitin-conjugating enzyme E2 J1
MAPSHFVRRLLREVNELAPDYPTPNPTFHAFPVSDSDLHEWHFTLTGPPSPSPYAGGLYHGRITLPPTYPLKPPNFRFLTPSGRFEVNRQICLSISGFHEETWMPAWGVRTALTALRSFMAEQGTAGQVGGMEASNEVRKRLAKESRSWRCGVCWDGRSNEEIMTEWWDICREKGARVEEEMGLEDLPPGLVLEAREPEGKGEEMENNTDSQAHAPRRHFETPSSPGDISTPGSPLLDDAAHFDDRVPPVIGSGPSSNPSNSTDNNAVVGPPPSRTVPGALTTPRARRGWVAETLAAAEASPTPMMDRAIGMVFIALLIMILKKLFYPAGLNSSQMEGVYITGD